MAFLFSSSCSFLHVLLPLLICYLPFVTSLSTISISETSNLTLICALNQNSLLNCTTFPTQIQISINSAIPFSGIVAGNEFLCGLNSPSTSSNSTMVCWRFSANGTVTSYKRIYNGPTLAQLDAGNSQICGTVDQSNQLECWQWRHFNTTAMNFSSIAVGEDFVCGLSEMGKIACHGNKDTGVIGSKPNGNYSVIAAGFGHACAISSDNRIDCWGDMHQGEKQPEGKFISLALGENRSCALRSNGTVFCWGENNFGLPESLQSTYFTTIEAKRSVFCGVVTSNYSLFCWGNEVLDSKFLVLENVLPGPCRKQCCCAPLSNSAKFCEQGFAGICKPCEREILAAVAPWPTVVAPSPPTLVKPKGSTGWNQRMVAFLVVGCVGSLALVLVASFFLFKYCKGRVSRVHDSGRLDEFGTPAEQGSSRRENNSQAQPTTGPVLEKRLSHLFSMGNGGQLEDFPLQVILEATNNFSEGTKIGTGGFGSVYHATLADGREVAIKRAETSTSSASRWLSRLQEDKDNAFLNELQSLSRINHKNLVRLLGFCEDSHERVLVYEYMKNGSIFDHIHTFETASLKSWPERLRVALDAARGIQYLHEYVVPPIIHRDIKSANILLDDKWAAKVSDFGLSLIGPEDDESHLSLRAAGTVGYMDPEYYRLQKLTTKSDVYSFGVVLLELLSGYRAIHKNDIGVPRNVVDVVVPYINQDEIHRILDPKLPPPTPFEIEVVNHVGYLAADCVIAQGEYRPSMNDVVYRLEAASNHLALNLAGVKMSRSSTESSVT